MPRKPSGGTTSSTTPKAPPAPPPAANGAGPDGQAPVKRGPGRPRKHPLPVTTTAVAPAPAPAAAVVARPAAPVLGRPRTRPLGTAAVKPPLPSKGELRAAAAAAEAAGVPQRPPARHFVLAVLRADCEREWALADFRKIPADYAPFDKATLRETLERLVRLGLVDRHNDASEARPYFSITEAGMFADEGR